MVFIASVDRLEPFIEPPFYISVSGEVCIRWIINKVDQKKQKTPQKHTCNDIVYQ